MAGQPQTIGSSKYVSPPVYTVEGPKLAGYEAQNRAVTNGESKSNQAGKSKVEGILEERGNRYGPFLAHARIVQNLKADIEGELQVRFKTLDPDMKQALDVICDKIARIINGDETYVDNWDDIAGYATLVSKRLTGNGI